MTDTGERIDAASVGLTQDRFRPPVRRDWIIARPSLTGRLVDATDADLVLVSGGAGYGKTTVGLLWDEADERPFVWVNIQPADADAHHLLRHVAVALQELEPLAAPVARAMSGPGRSVDTDLLPALSAELQRRPPLVLVIDDVHLVESSAEALRCLEGLVAFVPRGSTIGLLGRSVPGLALAKERMSKQVVELTTDDLAMSEDEARRLLSSTGLDVADDVLAELVRQTEGWAGGLHLAASVLDRRDRGGAAPGLLDRDGPVADYLVEEVLHSLPTETTSFLEQSAILDRFDGVLLDELQAQSGTAATLHELDRSGAAFLVPLDDRREWYRYHHLFAELLRERLLRRDPERFRSLNSRASRLLESRQDADGAIRHAVTAGESARAADLIVERAAVMALGGQAGLLQSWLDLLDRSQIEENPVVAVAASWAALATGDEETLRRALLAAERSTLTGPLADGTPSLTIAVAVLRAFAAPNGLDGVLRDAAVVREAGGVDTNPWWALATLVRGTALEMSGDLDAAREHLIAALPYVTISPPIDAVTRAHLGLLDLHAGDLVAADRWATEALDLADRHNLEGVLPVVSAYAIGALIKARVGKVAESDRASATTDRLLALIGHLSARTALSGYLYLAQAGLALGRLTQARVWLDEAQRARRTDGSATFLNEQLDDLRDQLAVGTDAQTAIIQPLTAAELRILAYLPTHLSLREIADTLIISRNTAKTHSVAIYRKLGVTSRSEAVDVARRLGMLPDLAQPSLR